MLNSESVSEDVLITSLRSHLSHSSDSLLSEVSTSSLLPYSSCFVCTCLFLSCLRRFLALFWTFLDFFALHIFHIYLYKSWRRFTTHVNNKISTFCQSFIDTQMSRTFFIIRKFLSLPSFRLGNDSLHFNHFGFSVVKLSVNTFVS